LDARDYKSAFQIRALLFNSLPLAWPIAHRKHGHPANAHFDA
jgi:hypothetical protein